MRAVVTVMGTDKTGIIAKTSGLLADNNVNILDITQTILQDIFTMIMMVDIEKCKVGFKELSDKLDELGNEIGVEIRIQHTDIFNSMHRI
ncbi:MAG: ACT domain-containing protein [Eubacteriales bacterium]|nr:ACT domain-containing protein [Eubacteriales bacterium]MDO5586818.1 ACT domain-containing protein [Clostridia bacterium]MDY4212782.1 ACT domain-containing protein [Eubacteriales bacterium]MDY5231513.1 ACT domain-containing protein [Eubacteriales bacterium]